MNIYRFQFGLEKRRNKMINKKKEIDILERHEAEREKIYVMRITFVAVLLLCTFTGCDFMCFNSFSQLLFNEDVIISILVSLIGAAGLDVSSYAAGLVVSTPVPGTARARKNRAVKVVFYILCFLICYAGLVYLANTVASQTGSDIMTDGTLFRVMLPAATSLLSFALGWRTDCTTPMIRMIERQLAELDEEIDIIRTNCRRMRAAMEKYDPDAYDKELYLCALDRLKAQMNMAKKATDEGIAVELKDVDGAAKTFLGRSDLYDPGEAFSHLRDYEPVIRPDDVHHSGDIPEVHEKAEADGEDGPVRIHKIGSVA